MHVYYQEKAQLTTENNTTFGCMEESDDSLDSSDSDTLVAVNQPETKKAKAEKRKPT